MEAFRNFTGNLYFNLLLDCQNVKGFLENIHAALVGDQRAHRFPDGSSIYSSLAGTAPMTFSLRLRLRSPRRRAVSALYCAKKKRRANISTGAVGIWQVQGHCFQIVAEMVGSVIVSKLVGIGTLGRE